MQSVIISSKDWYVAGKKKKKTIKGIIEQIDRSNTFITFAAQEIC